MRKRSTSFFPKNITATTLYPSSPRETSVLPRFIVPANISDHNAPGKGFFVCGKAEKPSFEVAGRASGTARQQRPSERLYRRRCKGTGSLRWPRACRAPRRPASKILVPR